MPPTHKPRRNTTLYLPPPAPRSDQAGSSSSPDKAPANAPSLDVLLMAQQIAHSRGHTFDIESFLLPEQREEYLAYLSHEGSSGEPEAETDVVEVVEAVEVVENGTPEADKPEEPRSGSEETEQPGPREPVTPPPAKRIKTGSHSNTPLAQVYWKQRLDRLALAGRGRSMTPRSSTPRASVKPEPEEPGTPSTPAPHTPHHGKHKGEQLPLTPAEKASIQESASYW